MVVLNVCLCSSEKVIDYQNTSCDSLNNDFAAQVDTQQRSFRAASLQCCLRVREASVAFSTLRPKRRYGLVFLALTR